MADFSSLYGQNLYLSPEQQDLLMAALSSNNTGQQHGDKKSSRGNTNGTSGSTNDNSPSHQSNGFDPGSTSYFESPLQEAPGSANLGFGSDESPYLDFDPDLDFDPQSEDNMIGDLPDFGNSDEHELGDKRKSLDGMDDDLENGRKRRESDDSKSAKKPGRKPLTSEPTSKRKAQNRAAQRAFRERKEKHLKDLETKVDELEKSSESTSHENGILRAQVERLQVELREYRKRLSWMSSGNGFSTANALQNVNSRSLSGGLSNNEFIFDFPKFGDLPASHIFNNGTMKDGQNKARDSPSSAGASPATKSKNASDRGPISNPGQSTPKMTNKNQISGFANGAPSGYRNGQASRNENISGPNTYQHQAPASSSASNTDSPSASSESQHGHVSSIGTSPEPSLNSPSVGKTNENGIEGHGDSCTHNTANGEKSFCDQLNLACGNINNPVPVAMNKSNNKSQLPGQQTSNSLPEPSISLDWLTQQNGGNFDPVLFNDYRESQDAILSQDFGTFFNDAFPLPDLGSPFHNFNDVTSPPIQQLQKKDLIAEIDNKLDEDDEVVPGEDQAQMLSCTKIWDRLQSMEKFRNGEIDVDSLCTELRTKARCSEGGVVVDQKDVEDIMGRASTTQ